jgi:hypothetical protein
MKNISNSEVLYGMLRQRCTHPTFGNNSLQPLPGAITKLATYKEQILNLSCDQAELVSKILLGTQDVLTCIGEAGSGKSYTLKLVRDICKDCFNTKVVTVSAIGICAHNVEGKTLHSTFGIRMSYPVPKEVDYMLGKVVDETGAPIYRESYRERISSIAYRALSNLSGEQRDLIIFLDEFATTPSQFLVAMQQIAECCRQNGLIKWVLIGDPNQALMVDLKSKVNLLNYPWERARFVNNQKLETIEYGSLIHEGPFLCGTQRKHKWEADYFCLFSNHRQGKEFDFINDLRTIAKGEHVKPKSIVASRLFSKLPDDLNEEDCTFIFASNKNAREHNYKFYEAATVKKEYKAHISINGVIGNLNLYEPETLTFSIIEEKTMVEHTFKGKQFSWLFNLTTPVVNQVYVGQRFMITENDAGRNLFNGMIGVVTHLGHKDITVQFGDVFHKIAMTLERDVPDTLVGKKPKPAAIIKRLPGISANAITCNKSLGKTFDSPTVVVLNKYMWPRGVKNSGWLYVALSRVTTSDNLYILCQNTSSLIERLSLLNSTIFTEPSCASFVKDINSHVLRSETVSPAVKTLATPQVSIDIVSSYSVNAMIKVDMMYSYSYLGITDNMCIAVWLNTNLEVQGYEHKSEQYTDNLDSLSWHKHIVDYISTTKLTVVVGEDSCYHPVYRLSKPFEVECFDGRIAKHPTLSSLFSSIRVHQLNRNILVNWVCAALNINSSLPFILCAGDPDAEEVCDLINSL